MKATPTGVGAVLVIIKVTPAGILINNNTFIDLYTRTVHSILLIITCAKYYQVFPISKKESKIKAKLNKPDS